MTASGRDRLIRLSIAMAVRDPRALRIAMEACAEEMDQEPVEEVLLQSYLFLGYPVALNALGVWREVSGKGSMESVPDDWGGWTERGGEVCRIIYGGQYEGLRRNVRALHQDMERWMVVEGYGKVLGRPGLDLVTRELCIAALLAVLGAPKQLYSHLRGALNAGATLDEVEITLRLACGSLDQRECGEVEATWESVKARWTGSKEEN